MTSVLQRCFLIFFLTTSTRALTEMSNTYLDLTSLEEIAAKISSMFEESGNNPRIDPGGYNTKVAGHMERIVTEMSLYDSPPINISFLSLSLPNGTTEQQDFIINNDAVYSSMINIENMYEIYKSLIPILPTKNQILNTREYFPKKYHSGDFQASKELYSWAIEDNIEDIKSFYQVVLNNLQFFFPKKCEDKIDHTGQYFVFETWRAFLSFQLKALVVDTFIHHYGREYTDILSIKNRQQRVSRTLKKYHSFMKKAIDKAPEGIIENCDAKKLMRDYPDTNYVEMERLYQLTFLSPKKLNGECSDSCDDLYDPYKPSSECQGKIRNCRRGPNFNYCRAPEKSPRRYVWFESYENGPMSNLFSPMEYYRTPGNCPKERFHQLYSGFPSSCAHCLCTCEENRYFSTESTFIISTKMEMAEVNRNMVITGVKFMKWRRMLHTAVRQGKLMPGGRIQQSSNEWKNTDVLHRKEVDDLLTEAQDEELENIIKPMHRNNPIYENFIVIGSDLKHVNLNDLRCPSEYHVLTGVGLGAKQNENGIGGRIALFIKCHLVDWKKGKILSSSRGVDINDLSGEREELVIGQVPPNRFGIAHTERSTNKFVEIQMTSEKFDLGQSVIPWFDAQEVTTTKTVPLTGIGLYHRGAESSGGFFAYRAISINYTNFISP